MEAYRHHVAERAAELLGTKLGGDNVATMVELLDDEALSTRSRPPDPIGSPADGNVHEKPRFRPGVFMGYVAADRPKRGLSRPGVR